MKNEEFGANLPFPMPQYHEIWVTQFTEQSAIEFHERVNQRFAESPARPIIIHINSYGGEVDALFSMLDTMDAIRSVASPDFRFVTYATGKAHSAGAVLLAYGDVRVASPHARIMVHQVVGGVFGPHPANEVEFTEINRMNDTMLEILRRQTKSTKSLDAMKKLLNQNSYLSADDAHKAGIIDFVGSPIINESIEYELRVVLPVSYIANQPKPAKKEKKKNGKKAN